VPYSIRRRPVPPEGGRSSRSSRNPWEAIKRTVPDGAVLDKRRDVLRHGLGVREVALAAAQPPLISIPDSASARDSGHPALASSACSRKWSSSMSATSPFRLEVESGMVGFPSTFGVDRSRVRTDRVLCTCSATVRRSAIEKHAAGRAATVPGWFPRPPPVERTSSHLATRPPRPSLAGAPLYRPATRTAVCRVAMSCSVRARLATESGSRSRAS